ncbi:MAG: alpha-galactosidase [Clostridia bacterium]|nr:alpha-galactosidase [Clostridia bacterium]
MSLGFRLYFEDRTVFVSRDSMKAQAVGDTIVYTAAVNGAEVIWRFTPYVGGELVTLEVEGNTPLNLRRIDSLVLPVGQVAKDDRIAFLGRDMYSNETRYPDELGAEQEYGESCVGHFADLAGEGLLVAGVAPHQSTYASVVYKNADGGFEFRARTTFTEALSKECRLCAERVFLCRTDLNRFFDAYRALLPQSHFAMPELTGWNTWDYYLDRVTPADIAENVAALQKLPFANKMRYIVIDDGWQRGWGDWQENEKFSCGLAAVSDTIRAAGFLPGIWMAPLGVKADTAVFSKHPDWFCKNDAGELLFDMGLYYLDPTHPDAERFVLDAYRYQYECGFRLFKMDYVSPLLNVRHFRDPAATPYGALSRLVERVKAVTGPDAVVLGCSLPLECGADIAPSMRIGVDIHNHFSHAIWIAQSLAWSWMYNNRTTRIDPDFLVVRGNETSTEPMDGTRNDFVPPPRHLQTDKDRFKCRWRHGDQFNAIEAETWANLVAISGGNIFLSDRLSALNEKGIAIIERALKLAGDEVRPVYQKDDARLASLWLGDLGLLLVNWEDSPRRLAVSGITQTLCSDQPHTLENGVLTVDLRPHESFSAIFEA